MKHFCVKCGGELEIEDRVMRKDECPSCGADLHACIQCRFHSPGYRNDCTEASAEAVLDNERANFCDWFELAPGDHLPAGESKADVARSALEALFKKG